MKIKTEEMGCRHCKHQGKQEDGYPCTECKRNIPYRFYVTNVPDRYESDHIPDVKLHPEGPEDIPFIEAMKTFAWEYKEALRLSYVRKPLSYALYKTWKKYNETEEERSDQRTGSKG